MTARTPIACSGAADHHPQYLETDRHHVYPTYLCALLGVPKRTATVPLCSGCHDTVHHLLRDLINTGSFYRDFRHQPADGVRMLALEAFAWWRATLLSQVAT